MIEKLTKEQEARFPEFIKKWTDIGLSTEPANRKEAEEGVREMYAIAGLKEPKIVWCDSPMSQGLTRMIVQKLENDGELQKKIGASVGASVWDSVRASVRDSVRASVRDSVRDSVGASVWDSVWDSVRASVGDSVRDSVWDSVWDSVRASVRDSVWDSVRDSVGASVWASVWDSVRASVWDSVWDSVRASVRDSVGASVWDSGYGQHDANWLAFYDFFIEVNKLEVETEKLKGLWKVSKNAGWYLPHENICWISERHNSLHRNAAGQLHNDRGMALTYPDGWGIYALNGVRFEEELFKKITSRKMQFDEIMQIVDVDQRRQAMKYSNVWDFVKHAKGKEIDNHVKVGQDGRKIHYWLYHFPKGEIFDRKVAYAIYEDSMLGAAEIHMQGVPVECKSVAEAFAWKQSDDISSITAKQWEELELDVHFT